MTPSHPELLAEQALAATLLGRPERAAEIRLKALSEGYWFEVGQHGVLWRDHTASLPRNPPFLNLTR